MLYRLPEELYFMPTDLECDARIVIAIANVLRHWIFDKSPELLQYLNTSDMNIKRAIIGDIIKFGNGGFNPRDVITTFDNIISQYIQCSEDDTTAEGLPHRTHDTI